MSELARLPGNLPGKDVHEVARLPRPLKGAGIGASLDRGSEGGEVAPRQLVAAADPESANQIAAEGSTTLAAHETSLAREVVELVTATLGVHEALTTRVRGASKRLAGGVSQGAETETLTLSGKEAARCSSKGTATPSPLAARCVALRLVAAGDRSPESLCRTGLPALVLAAELLTSANGAGARGDVRSTASRTSAAAQAPQGRASAGRVSPRTQDGPKSQEATATAPDGEAAKLRVLERLRSKPRPQLPATKGVR